ncbi:MAG: acyl carrier protein [Eggerthellales bacterium]|nr:acyl carrier protein [Eggerthellales bacterium]
MATIDTIKDVLQENLDIDPTNVAPESTFETLGVDSLDLVELICELEDRLDIDFGEPEGLTTLADVVAHIESLQ